MIVAVQRNLSAIIVLEKLDLLEIADSPLQLNGGYNFESVITVASVHDPVQE
jgi:hypothetical protein